MGIVFKPVCSVSCNSRAFCLACQIVRQQLQMWNVLSGNRLIDKRRKQQAQRRHLLALHRIKPLVNNHSPTQYSFLYSRPKACQLKLDRQTDIETHNTILVERMMRATSYVRPKADAFLKETLNGDYRSRLSRKIDDGNQKLVKRLQETKSQYSYVSKGLREYDRYKSNMAFSRMDPYYDFEGPTAAVPKKQLRPASAKR